MPASAQSFRPPSVPLVTFDPYLSIWSAADHLTDRPTQHWTKRTQSLVSLIRVDGAAYRLMGNEPESVPALPQTGLQVTPTRSIYEFRKRQDPRDVDLHAARAAGGFGRHGAAAELHHVGGSLDGRQGTRRLALRQHQLATGRQQE